MSRLNQGALVPNPCVKYLQWKNITEEKIIDGEKVEIPKGGAFSYYDKDTKTNVFVKIPLEFAIIDPDLVTFKGFDEVEKRGLYSNEVRNQDQIVNLRSKDEKVLSFKLEDYKKHKDFLKGVGVKYTRSIYIAVEVKDEWEIWNLQLNGSSFTGGNDMDVKNPDEENDGWIAFTNNMAKGKMYSNFFKVTGFKNKKKGKIKFSIPVFEVGEKIDTEVGGKLDELNETLNKYFKYYFSPKDAALERKDADYEEKLPFDKDMY